MEANTVRILELPQMTIPQFCERYALSKEIQKCVNENGFVKPRDLLFEKNLGRKELGFKIGHVAELKWALTDMLLRSMQVVEVAVTPEGKYDLTGALSAI